MAHSLAMLEKGQAPLTLYWEQFLCPRSQVYIIDSLQFHLLFFYVMSPLTFISNIVVGWKSTFSNDIHRSIGIRKVATPQYKLRYHPCDASIQVSVLYQIWHHHPDIVLLQETHFRLDHFCSWKRPLFSDLPFSWPRGKGFSNNLYTSGGGMESV